MAIERIRMLTNTGVIELPIEVGSASASTVGKHWNATKQFLHSGDVDLLRPFEAKRVADHRFATDPSWIETWAARGELDYEDIYESGDS
jgi:hypothetical protein